MGSTKFLRKLETVFLNELDDKEIAPFVDCTDGEAVQQAVLDAFGMWFLRNRDDLLAREWIKKGWAELTVVGDASGHLKESYRVKPVYVNHIENWLEDEVR